MVAVLVPILGKLKPAALNCVFKCHGFLVIQLYRNLKIRLPPAVKLHIRTGLGFLRQLRLRDPVGARFHVEGQTPVGSLLRDLPIQAVLHGIDGNVLQVFVNSAFQYLGRINPECAFLILFLKGKSGIPLIVTAVYSVKGYFPGGQLSGLVEIGDQQILFQPDGAASLHELVITLGVILNLRSVSASVDICQSVIDCDVIFHLVGGPVLNLGIPEIQFEVFPGVISRHLIPGKRRSASVGLI